LNGVPVARRKRVNPACAEIRRIAAHRVEVRAHPDLVNAS